ncbi:unnamed protein product [Aphanomyces euteiches]
MAVHDLVLLSDVDEEHVVEALVARYDEDAIYTFIGPVLVALNPYKRLERGQTGRSIYDDVDRFAGRTSHENEPHPFAIAESAYAHLLHFQTNECILISGESGSGKTETSKHVLQYLAAMSCSTTRHVKSKRASDHVVDAVHRVLEHANPVLEAFGNAQTIRNHNSSRFGKYMLLQMNWSGHVVGGFVHNYLLEQNRVVTQAAGESSFHCFYYLLAGAAAEDKAQWKVEHKGAAEFAFLHHENRSAIPGIEDPKEAYKELADHMLAVGIAAQDQRMVFQQLAAILHLGNVDFVAQVDENHNSSCAIKPASKASLDVAAELLGVSAASLEDLMTVKTLTINQTDMRVPLTAAQGSSIRADTLTAWIGVKMMQSLARWLYQSIFSWLVDTINRGIRTSQEALQTMGILDIYGFEILDENAFEQLCINYVNEKLQQLFIAQTLEAEQAEYAREGIAWLQIDYFNNQIVCDLIEDPKMPGMFPLLDEQCAISQTSVDVLMHRFHETYSSHAYFIKSRMKGSTFSVRHYAGTVEYDMRGFAEANMDSFVVELANVLQSSKHAFVQSLAQLETRSERDKLKRPPSTSTQFRNQVNALLQGLQACNPHYIRCIKPNEKKAPRLVEKDLITAQIRCLGLVENVGVRRAGFCYRETYAAFLHRYKILSASTWPAPKQCSLRQATVELLMADDIGVLPSLQPVGSSQTTMTPLKLYKAHLAAKKISNAAVDPSDAKILPFEQDKDSLGGFSLGQNKIFIKHPTALFSLERLRQDKLPQIAKIIEAAWQRRLVRLRLFKYLDVYNDVTARYEAVLLNIQQRLRRDTMAKEDSARLYASWHALADKVLPDTTRFHKRLALDEEFNRVSFATSFIKRNAAMRRLRLIKNAVKIVGSRWRGYHVRATMPPALLESCYQAMLGIRTEFEKLFGQKKRRRDTLDREYVGDYLGLVNHPHIEKFFTAANERQVLFAGHTIKVNERFVPQARLLLIGETFLHNIKAPRIDRPKERRLIPITDLAKLSLSPFHDNYLFIHVIHDGVGLMYNVHQKSEIALALRKRFRQICGRELLIEISDEISFEARRGRRLTFKFIKNPLTHATSMKKIDRHHGEILVGTKTPK